MAYLDIQFSQQEMGVVVDNIPVETEQPVSSVNDATSYTENSNVQIARNLKVEKSRLINALSQFPVTALWLLKEYEQKASTAEQDDEATLESELATDTAQ